MQAKDDEVYELKQACEDLQDDITSFEKKERELLSFSEKLASSNAELQTSKTALEKKVTELTASLGYYWTLKHSYALINQTQRWALTFVCLINTELHSFPSTYVVCFSSMGVLLYIRTYLRMYVCRRSVLN